MSRVRICGGGLLKRYTSNDAACSALARAEWLSRRGVRTPQGVMARHRRLIAFELISGVSGRAAAAPRVIEPALFASIVRLHALTPGLPLPRFDPLAKIVPRLDPRAEALLQPEVSAALEAIDGFGLAGSALHGDLHAGQLILDAAGSAWLLDLDDMCLGDPAADIGNFAAHLATSAQEDRDNPRACLALRLEACLAAYRQAGGAARPALAEAYGRLALIRRALKFREKGDARLFDALCSSG